MASSRAEEVAEILWELKRAEKVAKYSTIARRAGFSAGSNGRAMMTCLRTVRRDWPHLQWWRAVKDDGLVEKGSEQEEQFRQAGFDLEPADDAETVSVSALDDHLMDWEASEDGDDSEEAAAAE